jgi:hypothetical protein
MVSYAAEGDAKRQTADPFLAHKEINDFALHAADGDFFMPPVRMKRSMPTVRSCWSNISLH